MNLKVKQRAILLGSTLGSALLGAAMVGGFQGVGFFLVVVGSIATIITIINVAIEGF